ncbi:hypothetical protein D9V29_14040 [Mycetocola manganoxydans]|uniref:Uncharacterized protein n=1 Tax=Mycetocola manganoxydans TaxID=699879 RepID=A0A3L6ZMV5_9MICO|nr:hypothetical protein D9V29_14040 [Mycetocola manganoxydans]
MSRRQVAGYLRELETSGAVKEVAGKYRRHPAIVPVGRMYAFEAKVSDWNRAISQAARYSTWADASGVVLLHPPKNLTDVVRHAKSLRLGLAIGDKWIVQPTIGRRANALHAGSRLLASERFIHSVGSLRHSLT